MEKRVSAFWNLLFDECLEVQLLLVQNVDPSRFSCRPTLQPTQPSPHVRVHVPEAWEIFTACRAPHPPGSPRSSCACDSTHSLPREAPSGAIYKGEWRRRARTIGNVGTGWTVGLCRWDRRTGARGDRGLEGGLQKLEGLVRVPMGLEGAGGGGLDGSRSDWKAAR